MNALEIKEQAKQFGADLVGIAPIERLAHLPPVNHPATLFPGVRSVIVVGHRIMRGTIRGVEEGTNFGSTYSCYGFNWVENQFMSRTVYHLACYLEDLGATAVPLLARQNAEQKFVPDYQQLAVAAGLGAIGKGGFLLTPQYGHRQRLALILTDLELAGDDPIALDFCDNCRACAEGCPLGAMVDKGGEVFERNQDICSKCKNGAILNPEGSDKVDRYAAACGRACMVALEKKIGNQFEHKFRKRSVWSIVQDGKPVDKAAFVGGVCPKQEA